MPRPKKFRNTKCNPGAIYFKPRGVPLRKLEEIILKSEELEAISLADFNGLKQEEAAKEMGISRPTFGRIINGARKKIAEAIIKGKSIKLETEMKDENSSSN